LGGDTLDFFTCIKYGHVWYSFAMANPTGFLYRLKRLLQSLGLHLNTGRH
jgi:hypothetical protein